jgi:threonylcarbamoyladenosine tRNA methylthiotransferase MtaB
VTEWIAQRRAAEMGKLGKILQDRCFREYLGRQLRVLVERPIAGHLGWMGGFSDEHCPVALPGGRELLGQFVSVAAERVEGGWIWGHRWGTGCQSAP